MFISILLRSTYARELAVVLLLFSFAINFAVSARPALPQNERAASGVVGTLAGGQYDAVVANFSERLRREMPASRVAQIWQSYLNAYGYYQGQLGSATKGAAVIIRCQMQKGAIDVQLVYDGDGRVAGFSVNPMDTSLGIKPPT